MTIKVEKQNFQFHTVDFDSTEVLGIMISAALNELRTNSTVSSLPIIDEQFKPTVIMDEFGCKVHFKTSDPKSAS